MFVGGKPVRDHVGFFFAALVTPNWSVRAPADKVNSGQSKDINMLQSA